MRPQSKEAAAPAQRKCCQRQSALCTVRLFFLSLSLSLFFAIAVQWRRHFVFRITMGHGTRKFTACCGKHWRWRSRKRLVAAYAVCLALSLSLSLSACLFVCLSVCTVSVAGLSLPFPFRSPLPRYLRLRLSLLLSLSLSICLCVFRALPL